MKTRLDKSQTEKLIKLGCKIDIETGLTPYQEVLDSHAYEFKDGRYLVYKNMSIGDIFNLIPPVISPFDDGMFYELNIFPDAEKKWRCKYSNGESFVFIGKQFNELIDALFDVYFFLIGRLKNRIKEDEGDDEDYFFTGRV